MATIKQVAEHAQVSQATVSHVINNTRFVSTSVKERVWKAMKELEYQPNSLARALRSGKTHTLGLLLPDSANPFFAEIGKAIEESAIQYGYSLILCNTEGDSEKERFYLDVLHNKRVDGIILVSVGTQTKIREFIENRNLPLVAVDRDFQDLAIDTVLTDNFQGAILATQHLISLGHERIACITGPSDVNPSAARETGYRQALSQAKINQRADYIVAGDFHPESGWHAARKLLQIKNPPTAIFACNDLMAFGVIRAVSEMGLRIPEDLSLVGYDDIELATYTTPALTTIAQPKKLMCQRAVEILASRVDQGEEMFTKEVLQPTLIVRSSCGTQGK